MAMGVVLIASEDLVLELAHTLRHSKQYLNGDVELHSHKYGDKIIVHHNHSTLEKIDKAIQQCSEGDSDAPLAVIQLLKLDQIKLILQDSRNIIDRTSIADVQYAYINKVDQEFISLLSPPPRPVSA